jgi:hypothetical protein
MRHVVRTNLAIVIVAVGFGLVWRALGFDGHTGSLGQIAFILIGMLLVSLTDRELFWDTRPRRRR